MKRAPRNYSQDMDRRRQGLDAIVGKLDSIPDPTTDDEGKVLKVDDEGKYTLLPDGGAAIVTAAITYAEGEYSCDKTHTQIVSAINAGTTVFATYDGRTYVYGGTGKESAGSPLYFSYIQADSESQMIEKVFEIDEDNEITFSQHDINNDTFKRRVYSGTISASASDPVSVVVNVDYLENDSLVDFYPDVNHVGVYPSSIVYDTSSTQRTVTLTFAAPITAGTFELVVWG